LDAPSLVGFADVGADTDKLPVCVASKVVSGTTAGGGRFCGAAGRGLGGCKFGAGKGV
jgi:hypothetical protein